MLPLSHFNKKMIDIVVYIANYKLPSRLYKIVIMTITWLIAWFMCIMFQELHKIDQLQGNGTATACLTASPGSSPAIAMKLTRFVDDERKSSMMQSPEENCHLSCLDQYGTNEQAQVGSSKFLDRQNGRIGLLWS